MTRPQRHRKEDRLTHNSASPAEIHCRFALGPFDTECRRMDAKWGMDRLPELVGPATAQRWATAMINLNAAIAADNPDLTAARVAACLRGFALMDAEATAAGHAPITPHAIEFDVHGKTCAILKDDAAWPAYRAARPDVRIVTLRELANALAAYDQTVAPIIAAFPDATIPATRKPTRLEAELNDEIPF